MDLAARSDVCQLIKPIVPIYRETLYATMPIGHISSFDLVKKRGIGGTKDLSSAPDER